MAKKRTTIFIDENNWKEFRSKVVDEGKSCSKVIDEFIKAYLGQSTPYNPPLNPNKQLKPKRR